MVPAWLLSVMCHSRVYSSRIRQFALVALAGGQTTKEADGTRFAFACIG